MEERAKKIVDVFPIGKGKRVLLWLCDMVIVFFLAYVLMNFAVAPLSNLATNFNAVSEQGTKAIEDRNKLLEKAELIYFTNPSAGFHDTNEGIVFTYKLFMSDYVANTGTYSHDVYLRYYSIYDTSENYYDLLADYDKEFGFFDINKNEHKIELKKQYRDMFNALADPGDVMSEEAKEKYNNYYSRCFYPLYNHMSETMYKNDFTYDGVSYCELSNKINNMNNHYDTMIVVDAFISYILSFGILIILIPLLKKKRQTISMMMMRIYRLNIRDFTIVNRKKYLLTSFYHFLVYLVPICILTFPLVNFNYMFSLMGVMYPCVISLVLAVFSMITLLVSSTNQASSDMLTNTIIVDTNTLDDIYRNKGYKI